MLLYNVATVALLAFAGIGLGLQGVALWPAGFSTRRWPPGVSPACDAVAGMGQWTLTK